MKKEKILNKSFYINLILIIIVIIVLIANNKLTNNHNDKDYINNNIIALTNDNRYLTISSIVDNYISYVKYQNVDNIMSILDKKYIEVNDINSNNIFEKIELYSTNYAASVREAYQVRSYNNIYIYYIKAKLIEEKFDSFTQRYIRDIYYKITINENDITFAISPLEKEEYINKVGELDEKS